MSMQIFYFLVFSYQYGGTAEEAVGVLLLILGFWVIIGITMVIDRLDRIIGGMIGDGRSFGVH